MAVRERTTLQRLAFDLCIIHCYSLRYTHTYFVCVPYTSSRNERQAVDITPSSKRYSKQKITKRRDLERGTRGQSPNSRSDLKAKLEALA